MQNRFQQIQKACQQHSPTLLGAKHALLVSIATQRMAFFENGELLREYTVSTSRKPPSCQQDSLGTPTGLHHIAEKIGSGEPEGTVFKGRKPIAAHWRELTTEQQAQNLITPRILRLRGDEPANSGEQCCSFTRYIYIHGTNQEDKLGTPNSHGCILLSNIDIIDLFSRIEKNTPVLIEKE